MNGRKAVIVTIQHLVQLLEILYSNIDNENMREAYKRLEVQLLQEIHPDSEYSAAALANSRAEIYKLDHGRLVRRGWLEEILNTHP